MQIVTNARNIELTDAIKTAVQQKLSRVAEHYSFIQEIHVILAVEKNPRIEKNQIAEATLHIPGAVIRVEAASENLYASIDALADKIERSLRKHKTKLMNRAAKSHDSIRREPEVIELDDEDDDILDEVELEMTLEPSN